MERRALKRLAALVVIALVAAGVTVAVLYGRRAVPAGASAEASEDTAMARVTRVVPQGTRIRVEVVNATTVRGLARRGTFYVRDLGFDVVDYSTARERRDTTLILDRSGHPQWAALAARALAPARVESRPDSSRYLDLTILLGASWRPPAQPFYP